MDDGAIIILNFLHLRKLQGPHDYMNATGENKNPRMQTRFSLQKIQAG